MSEVNENIENDESLFDVGNIFKNRFANDVEPQSNDTVKKEPIKESVKKSEVVKRDARPVVEESEAEDEVEEPRKPKEESKVDYKAELEKLQKTVKDTQRSFHEDRKKLSAYKRAVEKLKDEGTLYDDDATALLDHIRYDSEPIEETVEEKYYKIWDKELEYMRKYDRNNSDIDQQVLAFKHFTRTASSKELDDTFNELSQYEDDEVEFTKQMLEIGRQYNEDIYSDIHEAGSIRKLKERLSLKEEKLQKQIDKLQKQVDKYKKTYEDYDTEPANYKLPTGTGSVNIPEDNASLFDVAKIFASRNRR